MNKTIQKNFALISIIFVYSCNTGEKTPYEGKMLELMPPSASHIDFINQVDETQEANYMTYEGFYQGAGVATADFNNDGLPDIYFAGNLKEDKLYLNKGDMHFEDITESAGIANDKGWSAGVSVADVNHDGWLDIYVCKFLWKQDSLRHNLLYINNGDMTFTESAKAFGIDDDGYSVQASFFDYDRDGDLDLYVVNQPPDYYKDRQALSGYVDYKYTDRLYENMGQNHFVDVTGKAGISNYAYGLSATVADIDNDGWPDIYVACDYEAPDFMYINNHDGTFTNHINQSLRHISNYSMGSDVADFNNDGFLDIYEADMVAPDNYRLKANMSGMNPQKFWNLANAGMHYQYMFNSLQLNRGNRYFSEMGQMANVSETDWSWTAMFSDLDNDGLKDLIVTNGMKRDVTNTDYRHRIQDSLKVQQARAQANGIQNFEPDWLSLLTLAPSVKLSDYLFHNKGDLTFKNVAAEWGFDRPGWDHGVALADLDQDGDLDMVVNSLNDTAHIYQNHTNDLNDNNYINFTLKGNSSNPFSYGARVEIYTPDSSMQVQELIPVRGFMSSNEPIIHFGLQHNQKVDKIIIRWPSGHTMELNNLEANKTYELYEKEASLEYTRPNITSNPLFADVSSEIKLHYKHQENNFDDYARESLIPYKMSQLGPSISCADVNGDSLPDFFIGGALGQSGKIFYQTTSGKFEKSNQAALEADKSYEDIGSSFFDADGDGDMDLYVSSGGNEYDIGSTFYRDRLYLNDGQGHFSKATNALPDIRESSGCVKVFDYDQDGDQDVFIAGRQKPGQYPFPASSYILRNDQGKFTNVSQQIAPALKDIGMVTDAVWTDINQDNNIDLVLVGEWMPIRILENQAGRFIDQTQAYHLDQETGFWNTISAADFDQDGDMDLVAGNMGLNQKYKASESAPFSVYCTDFDENGSLDIVLGYVNNGVSYPLRGRSCSSRQMPYLKDRFPTYDTFASSSIETIYGDKLNDALHYDAHDFASVYLENKGNRQFEINALPMIAQISTIFDIIPFDFDLDGNLDLIVSGNLYAREIETQRNDGGYGLYMKGDGHGHFKAVPIVKSGFFTPGDVKQLALTYTAEGFPLILVAKNNDYMQAIVCTSRSADAGTTTKFKAKVKYANTWADAPITDNTDTITWKIE